MKRDPKDLRHRVTVIYTYFFNRCRKQKMTVDAADAYAIAKSKIVLRTQAQFIYFVK